MTFLASLRAFLFLYVAIHTQAMHRLIAIVALVAIRALLYPFRVSFFMMAIITIHSHLFMGLMGKLDRTDSAFHRRRSVGGLAICGCL